MKQNNNEELASDIAKPIPRLILIKKQHTEPHYYKIARRIAGHLVKHIQRGNCLLQFPGLVLVKINWILPVISSHLIIAVCYSSLKYLKIILPLLSAFVFTITRLTAEFSRPEKHGTSKLWVKCQLGFDRTAFQARLQRLVRRGLEYRLHKI